MIRLSSLLFFVLVFVLFLTASALAQEESQIGVRVIAANSSIDPSVKHRTFGVGADTVINLGQHVSIHGLGQVSRLKLDGLDQPLRYYEGDGDLRVSPFKQSGLRLFALAGANVQRISSPFGGQTFMSPTLGGGAGFKYGSMTFKNGFSDMLSALGTRYKEIGADGYVPFGQSAWIGRMGVRYRRSTVQNTAAVGLPTEFSVVQMYAGVAHLLGKGSK